MTRGRGPLLAAVAAVEAVALAGAAGAVSGVAAGPAAAAEPAGPSDDSPEAFWADREQSYRATRRGPFTAIRADYLRPGEGLVLWVVGDSLTADAEAEGPRGAAIEVRFAPAGCPKRLMSEFTHMPARNS